MASKNQTTLYITPEEDALLTELARRMEVSRSEMVRLMIRYWAKQAHLAWLPGADLANIADPDDAPDRRDPIAESYDARG